MPYVVEVPSENDVCFAESEWSVTSDPMEAKRFDDRAGAEAMASNWENPTIRKVERRWYDALHELGACSVPDKLRDCENVVEAWRKAEVDDLVWWLENALPDYERSDALARAYGALHGVDLSPALVERLRYDGFDFPEAFLSEKDTAGGDARVRNAILRAFPAPPLPRSPGCLTRATKDLLRRQISADEARREERRESRRARR